VECIKGGIVRITSPIVAEVVRDALRMQLFLDLPTELPATLVDANLLG
jgi:hypothetical protein